jgi:hypothetical protein
MPKEGVKMAHCRSQICVPEDLDRLKIMEHARSEIEVDNILESLRRDSVVLIKRVTAEEADCVIHDVADRLDLGDSLKLQAGFAAFQGRRHNIGRYFMSVNKRDDYQFVPPHSEGNSFIGMQLASFFCYENGTDGGETILMNVNDSSAMWLSLRERVRRARLGSRPLAPHEISKARGLYQINLPADVLRDDDQILQERRADIPGIANPSSRYKRYTRWWLAHIPSRANSPSAVDSRTACAGPPALSSGFAVRRPAPLFAPDRDASIVPIPSACRRAVRSSGTPPRHS